MLESVLKNVREQKPLVHCITNYVTVNDCANMVLACGASPIMADDEQEADQITSVCGGLAINIGTLNSRTIASMQLSGERANALGTPTVFDPVGAGASTLRTETAFMLLEKIRFSAIRGNVSEIRTLAKQNASTQGVDAAAADAVTKENLPDMVRFAKAFSEKTGSIIAMTGEIDIVADMGKAYAVYNGHRMMSQITGTGCMLTSVMAAFLAVNPEARLEAALAAVCAVGLCGEIAAQGAQKMNGGTGTMRMLLIDAMSMLDGKTLNEGARYEIC